MGLGTRATGLSLSWPHEGQSLALCTQLWVGVELAGPCFLREELSGAETGAVSLGGDLYCSEKE